ncbi:hypothetical protein DHEL01_v209306 [Diaporthe helianthi]|uniref:DUF7704 domain-containing protein n=1 Tax=Diaporthe helianthi TaxID=158607 RepID=A0A2P5HPU8_DIAHE|nr:hypothetical protein DHEL01_v209306 [Diaporthe helianthi]
MAYSTLPTIPLLIFGVIEPLMLGWAYFVNIKDPFSYYADQVPQHNLNPEQHFPGQALSITMQLGNVLLLLAALAVVCCFSPSSATARWYLVAVAFADYGHIYATYCSLDPDVFWDPARWNDLVAGSIGASAVLNVARWLTVLGAFGPLKDGVGLDNGKVVKKVD